MIIIFIFSFCYKANHSYLKKQINYITFAKQISLFFIMVKQKPPLETCQARLGRLPSALI